MTASHGVLVKPYNNITTEQTNNQQTTIVYQPNSFISLFKMEQNTHNPKQPIQLTFYQVDHLGTPLRLINELSHIIWQADPDDWRSVENTQGIHQPIRYQGQYEDQETGLYYNRYRYYSPDLGRYISHDPIGLAGGFNTYNYVTNPNNWVDPMGLELSPARQVIRKRYFSPNSAIQEFGITDAGVNQWLCRAVLSEKSGYIVAYNYLSDARSFGLDGIDPNIAAAKRYMEGYVGNYTPNWMFGQHNLKILRDSPTWNMFEWTQWVRNNTIGRNGSYSGFSGIIAEWDYQGWADKQAGAPIGGFGGTGSCQLNK